MCWVAVLVGQRLAAVCLAVVHFVAVRGTTVVCLRVGVPPQMVGKMCTAGWGVRSVPRFVSMQQCVGVLLCFAKNAVSLTES